ncbi:MAG TPA: BTAD domain-containing putative transcriptional regulator, partial [Streptosporangiaceae bacterium]|nr:BTAD domain-containing putative transcriptional regulator [Streptosporangiaceae bacterium]
MADPVIAGPGGGVRFGLLGPLQVVDEAGVVRVVPAAKQRIMLAALLLSAGEVVRAGVLAEALWDADPPPNAAAAMRTYVMRLRHALGPAGVRVVARPGGWAVQLGGPAELDLAEAEELWAAARAAAGAGDWQRASSLLGQALGMWRGEPLVDVPSAALARRDAGRLGELRSQLTEARIDADLRLGRHGVLVPELQRLAAEHPLREHVWVQLMLACYRSGRQAAALAAYADARAILAGELGVEPGPELRELHRQVLAADPALTADLPGDVVVGERAGVFQLPAAPADFTGRAADCERIVGAVAAGGDQPGVPVVAICGPPGIGKTTLALHVGHMLRDRFPDGQLWAELAGSSARPRAPGEVLGELLRALGTDGLAIPAGDAERAACFRSRLAGSRVLVVVDDAVAAAQVRLLMPGTAGCAVVVTSRAGLEGLDGALLVPLEVMTDQDAVGLLARIVGRR